MNSIIIVYVPFLLILSGSAENIILTFYGNKWINASKSLSLLILSGAIIGCGELLKSFILAKGAYLDPIYLYNYQIVYFCFNYVLTFGTIRSNWINSWIFIRKCNITSI